MPAESIAISRQVARRYVLGRQGLWPGRRWAEKEGAAAAIRAIEALQLDAVTIVARSHDLVLWSRVADYQPAQLEELVYQERRFFEYGAHLDVYPIEELPYWRLHMRRRRDDARLAALVETHPTVLDEVRALVRERGPVANRDLEGSARVSSYRGRKDTALGLFHLWLTGELMSHGRSGFERRYDLFERIAPPDQAWEAGEAETEGHFASKALREYGLANASMWKGSVDYALHLRVPPLEARAWLDRLVAEGEAARVEIDGVKGTWYLPVTDLSLLADLAADRIPTAWTPLGPTTADEVTLLSPLDNLLRRERTRALFDFDYVWEIYKKPEKRRWGAFTMPILYEDRLVARLEPKLDRKTATLAVTNFWPEDPAILEDPVFRRALDAGLSRFATFHEARLSFVRTPNP